ncbi:mite allergen Der f 3-like [Copidosoma floridanum]|uniref:mite allergen Der f 3-like n=1 Tax=Copidosoma floridanum TaxID=29053 RepID=UPI0006C9CA7F|nr:mite allergen Der f 3-like [Copidosoma floridanum]
MRRKVAALSLEHENIVGGEIASITDYPYHVYVSVANSVCNGAILDKYHIISAAHCVMDNQGQVQSQIKVSAGIKSIYEISASRFDAYVDTVYLHQDFNPVEEKLIFSGDIAVLKLDKIMLLDDLHMAKVELPPLLIGHNPEFHIGTEPVLTGFGYNAVTIDRSHDNKISVTGNSFGELQFAKTRVLSLKECSRTRPHGGVNLLRELCSQMEQPKETEGTMPRGACLGDSGGPLVLKSNEKNLLIGILSRGPKECNEQLRPSVYTRTSYYRDFIECVMHNSSFPETECNSVSWKIKLQTKFEPNRM